MKLSKTSKMPCLSWSLIAKDHCPGARGDDGKLVPACSGCYADDGFYKMAPVRAPRLHNAEDWKRDMWVEDMVTALQRESHFRWFDSGDMYALPLAVKILEVMRRTNWVKHWLPTRMHKFAKFARVLSDMAALPNVVVRFSSDSIRGETIDGATTSTIFSDSAQLPANAEVCGAYTRKGKCGPCRTCWSKDVPVVAYPAHGRVMMAVIARAG